MVTITMEIIGVDLDVEIEAEGEGEISGMVDLHGMEVTEMMNQGAKGLKSHGTGGILMVAEEEGEAAMGEVIVTKVITLGQEMVAAGALAGETVDVGAITRGRTVKEAGLSLPTGMQTRKAAKEVELSREASPAGKHKTHLVEMIRRQRIMQAMPGVRTDHPPLSWVSQAAMLTSPALGVAPLEELETEVPGERATMIAGTRRGQQPQINLHGVVGQKLLPRKMMVPGTKVARRARAKEEVVAVPGTKRRTVHGTATRVATLTVVDGKACYTISSRLVGAMCM